MSGENESEAELIGRARRGNRDAFGRLTRMFLKRVYTFCRRMGLSHDEADDMTQETFIKAYGAISRFEEGRPFWSWIARIAANSVINYRKRKGREIDGEEGEAIVARQSDPAAGNPQAQVETKEMEARLEEALWELPFDFRVVYIMRMHLDMKYEEIASVLEIPVGTVMSRLGRSRDRLLNSLKDLLEA
jgi:RNA polymerase sigma-70 factor (ECF subfamily)